MNTDTIDELARQVKAQIHFYKMNLQRIQVKVYQIIYNLTQEMIAESPPNPYLLTDMHYKVRSTLQQRGIEYILIDRDIISAAIEGQPVMGILELISPPPG